MSLLFPTLLVIVGFILLVIGADFLVNGASSLAKRLNVSEIVIGLTIVAFGTSTPELVVSIISALEHHSGIVFGNVIGSNIFNVLLILGIAGLIYPLSVLQNTVWKEIPCSLGAGILLLILVNDVALFGANKNQLTSFDGLILLLFFVLFILCVFVFSNVNSANNISVEQFTILKTIILISGGFIGLFIGGKLVVDNSVIMANHFSLSEKFIGLTIIAGGTSLPELATSAVAAYKKRFDIAVGNIIGSNIFNILFILGISSILKNAQFDTVLNVDLIVMNAAALFLFIAMFTGKAKKLDRWEAVLFLLADIGYITYLFFRK